MNITSKIFEIFSQAFLVLNSFTLWLNQKLLQTMHAIKRVRRYMNWFDSFLVSLYLMLGQVSHLRLRYFNTCRFIHKHMKNLTEAANSGGPFSLVILIFFMKK